MVRSRQEKTWVEVETSVTWRGREIENPVLRPLAALATIVLGTVMAALALIVAVFGVAFTAVLVPLTFPLHIVLRLLGRKGFLDVEGGRVRYAVERRGFREAP